MKYIILFSLLLFIGCSNHKEKTATTTTEIEKTGAVQAPEAQENEATPKIYSNQRFKEVTVEKSGKDSFLIKGQAQIFEANISWVIEEGHNELKKGFETATVGAPEWGFFEFTIGLEKINDYSTLMLILYESSAKDGSRQHELPIVLE